MKPRSTGLQLFVSLQNKVANNACATQEGYITVRQELHLLVKYTNVVLVQMFLPRLMEEGERQTDYVEMYALAIMPQISLCDGNPYDIFLIMLLYRASVKKTRLLSSGSSSQRTVV